MPPAGWGFAYMDHLGAYLMAAAVLAGLVARNRTGKGQWIDFSCVEAGIGLAGPELLDATVNGRPMRRDGRPNSNTENFPAMVPHGVYAAAAMTPGWRSPAGTMTTGTGWPRSSASRGRSTHS